MACGLCTVRGYTHPFLFTIGSSLSTVQELVVVVKQSVAVRRLELYAAPTCAEPVESFLSPNPQTDDEG